MHTRRRSEWFSSDSDSDLDDDLLECQSTLITSNLAITTGLMALITGELALQSEKMAFDVGQVALDAGRTALECDQLEQMQLASRKVQVKCTKSARDTRGQAILSSANKENASPQRKGKQKAHQSSPEKAKEKGEDISSPPSSKQGESKRKRSQRSELPPEKRLQRGEEKIGPLKEGKESNSSNNQKRTRDTFRPVKHISWKSNPNSLGEVTSVSRLFDSKQIAGSSQRPLILKDLIPSQAHFSSDSELTERFLVDSLDLANSRKNVTHLSCFDQEDSGGDLSDSQLETGTFLGGNLNATSQITSEFINSEAVQFSPSKNESENEGEGKIGQSIESQAGDEIFNLHKVNSIEGKIDRDESMTLIELKKSKEQAIDSGISAMDESETDSRSDWPSCPRSNEPSIISRSNRPESPCTQSIASFDTCVTLEDTASQSPSYKSSSVHPQTSDGQSHAQVQYEHEDERGNVINESTQITLKGEEVSSNFNEVLSRETDQVREAGTISHSLWPSSSHEDESQYTQEVTQVGVEGGKTNKAHSIGEQSKSPVTHCDQLTKVAEGEPRKEANLEHAISSREEEEEKDSPVQVAKKPPRGKRDHSNDDASKNKKVEDERKSNLTQLATSTDASREENSLLESQGIKNSSSDEKRDGKESNENENENAIDAAKCQMDTKKGEENVKHQESTEISLPSQLITVKVEQTNQPEPIVKAKRSKKLPLAKEEGEKSHDESQSEIAQKSHLIAAETEEEDKVKKNKSIEEDTMAKSNVDAAKGSSKGENEKNKSKDQETVQLTVNSKPVAFKVDKSSVKLANETVTVEINSKPLVFKVDASAIKVKEEEKLDENNNQVKKKEKIQKSKMKSENVEIMLQSKATLAKVDASMVKDESAKSKEEKEEESKVKKEESKKVKKTPKQKSLEVSELLIHSQPEMHKVNSNVVNLVNDSSEKSQVEKEQSEGKVKTQKAKEQDEKKEKQVKISKVKEAEEKEVEPERKVKEHSKGSQEQSKKVKEQNQSQQMVQQREFNTRMEQLEKQQGQSEKIDQSIGGSEKGHEITFKGKEEPVKCITQGQREEIKKCIKPVTMATDALDRSMMKSNKQQLNNINSRVTSVTHSYEPTIESTRDKRRPHLSTNDRPSKSIEWYKSNVHSMSTSEIISPLDLASKYRPVVPLGTVRSLTATPEFKCPSPMTNGLTPRLKMTRFELPTSGRRNEMNVHLKGEKYSRDCKVSAMSKCRSLTHLPFASWSSPYISKKVPSRLKYASCFDLSRAMRQLEESTERLRKIEWVASMRAKSAKFALHKSTSYNCLYEKIHRPLTRSHGRLEHPWKSLVALDSLPLTSTRLHRHVLPMSSNSSERLSRRDRYMSSRSLTTHSTSKQIRSTSEITPHVIHHPRTSASPDVSRTYKRAHSEVRTRVRDVSSSWSRLRKRVDQAYSGYWDEKRQINASKVTRDTWTPRKTVFKLTASTSSSRVDKFHHPSVSKSPSVLDRDIDDIDYHIWCARVHTEEAESRQSYVLGSRTTSPSYRCYVPQSKPWQSICNRHFLLNHRP